MKNKIIKKSIYKREVAWMIFFGIFAGSNLLLLVFSENSTDASINLVRFIAKISLGISSVICIFRLIWLFFNRTQDENY